MWPRARMLRKLAILAPSLGSPTRTAAGKSLTRWDYKFVVNIFGDKNNVACMMWWSNAAGILFLFKANPFWPKLRRSRLKGNVDGVFLKLNWVQNVWSAIPNLIFITNTFNFTPLQVPSDNCLELKCRRLSIKLFSCPRKYFICCFPVKYWGFLDLYFVILPLQIPFSIRPNSVLFYISLA